MTSSRLPDFQLPILDFRRVLKSLSNGCISDGHVTLLMILTVMPDVSVSFLSRVLNVHANTAIKRLKLLQEHSVVLIDPERVKSGSRFRVKQINYKRLAYIEPTTKKARDRSKTNKVLDTISQIKKVLPEIKRGFSTHPRFYTPVWNLIASGIDVESYVRWLDKTHDYFSLGLMCSSWTIARYHKEEKNGKIQTP